MNKTDKIGKAYMDAQHEKFAYQPAVTDSRTVASDKYLADSCGKNNAGTDESVEAGFKSAFQYDLETRQLQAELDTLTSARKDFNKTASVVRQTRTRKRNTLRG